MYACVGGVVVRLSVLRVSLCVSTTPSHTPWRGYVCHHSVDCGLLEAPAATHPLPRPHPTARPRLLSCLVHVLVGVVGVGGRATHHNKGGQSEESSRPGQPWLVRLTRQHRHPRTPSHLSPQTPPPGESV
jgi:hypothetical protein